MISLTKDKARRPGDDSHDDPLLMAAQSNTPVANTPVASLTVSRLRGSVCRIMTLLDFAATSLEPSAKSAMSSINQAAAILLEEIGQPLQVTHVGAVDRGSRGNTLLPWQIQRILAYIEAHLAEPIRVCDLSALVGLAEGYFSRAFRRRFGAPPHTYIVRRRVQHSARLMLEGHLPLSQVALRCGFSDQAHLNKSFRKLMGTTPARWRRSNKGHCADLPHSSCQPSLDTHVLQRRLDRIAIAGNSHSEHPSMSSRSPWRVPG
jgi:AraC family transcriptional regulator